MQRFNLLPDVIKNLIIINGLFFLGTGALTPILNIPISDYLALHLPSSGYFEPYQLITHLFMHANLRHILFNMFALWMFGYALENIWGAKRFLNYYLITGFGAALLHFGAQYFEFQLAVQDLNFNQVELIKEEGYRLLQNGQNYVDPDMAYANMVLNTPTVGASGAVFGILLAFGMLFPNQPIYLYFLFPIKAKYLVAGFGLIELVSGFSDFGGTVAHFAHLGGMLFGFLILQYWKKKHGSYY
jgi:membrane associated rhomboid family serine protease